MKQDKYKKELLIEFNELKKRLESKEEEQDYHGHFYHPYINSGKYREVWKSGKYNNGIHVSPSIFSKEIQGLIMLDKVLVINNND